MALSPPRVLSFAGNVVHGFCAHKTTTYVIQLLGIDVDPFDIFLYCNHSGFPKCQGIDTTMEGFVSIRNGLRDNDLLDQSHVMTGIFKSPELLLQSLDIIREQKNANPDLVYICDPVIGDNRHKYFADVHDVTEVLLREALPLADIILPNQSEAEWLTGMRIKTEADALGVIQKLHDVGPSTVVLTSVELDDSDVLYGYASCEENGKKRVYRTNVPKLDVSFFGAGDLFSALWVVWSIKHPGDIRLIYEKVASTLQIVLKRTELAAKDECGPDVEPTAADLVLRLIQSKRDIEKPKICVDVELIVGE